MISGGALPITAAAASSSCVRMGLRRDPPTVDVAQSTGAVRCSTPCRRFVPKRARDRANSATPSDRRAAHPYGRSHAPCRPARRPPDARRRRPGPGRVAATRGRPGHARVRPGAEPVRGRPPSRRRPRGAAGQRGPGALLGPRGGRRPGRDERARRDAPVRPLARDPLPLATVAVRRGGAVSRGTVLGTVGALARAPGPAPRRPPRRRARSATSIRCGSSVPRDPVRRLRSAAAGRDRARDSPVRRRPRVRTRRRSRRPRVRVRRPVRGRDLAPWPAWAGLALVLAGAGVRWRRRADAPRPGAAACAGR